MAISQIEKEIGKRLEALLPEVKKGKKEFSNDLGINESQFTRMMNGKAGISPKVLLDVSSKHKVSLEWLIEGTGGIFKEKSGDQKPPDSHLLTLIENHVKTVRLSLDELSKAIVQPVGPGTNAHPHLSQTVSKSDRKNRRKKQGGT